MEDKISFIFAWMPEIILNDEHTTLLTQHLSQYISEHKKKSIEAVLDQRTRHITVVLEDIFQSQNASAVFRTAECFGIQDIHLIENINKYSVNKRVLRGANKWLTVYRHKDKTVNNTTACLTALKAQGFRIMATMPSAQKLISEVDVSGKVAVIMGNELHGISSEAIELADERVKILMYGFTESLNLSVSAALCVSELVTRLHRENISWRLSDAERRQLRLDWYRKVVRNAATIERLFFESIQ